jgi:type II secretory pathway pseudopilin PulG
MKRTAERGSAMLVVMIVMAALLAGAAVLVSLQLGSNRSTELTRTGISALYCAEAGLTASRTVIADNQSTWSSNLGTGTEPSWLTSGVEHDLDGDGSGDFIVTLEDNWDETGTDVPGTDSDGKIFVVSRCIKYPDVPREVRELITFVQITNCYTSQRGGCGGNGNMNR